MCERGRCVGWVTHPQWLSEDGSGRRKDLVEVSRYPPTKDFGM